MKTRILVTFATEDPITYGHDEILCKLCRGLADRGIPGGFHLTGDFVRSLRSRGRSDVIAVLREHETGYHSNTHASYPFLGDFGERLEWDEAVARYMQTESRGIEDVCDVIGRAPSYIVTEFLKVPQLVEAYRKMGFRYAGLNSGMPGSDTGAVAYMGMYCYGGQIFGMERPPCPGRLEAGLSELRKILESRPPALKIFLHPYKLIYNSNIEAWYGENNFYRHYDPAAYWRQPEKSLYQPETTEQLLNEFFALLDCAVEYDVEFIRTDEHLDGFVRPAGLAVPASEALDLWQEFCVTRDAVKEFTPAEITAMRSFMLAHPEADMIPVRTVCGPVDELKINPAKTAMDAEISFEYSGRMPVELPPELFVAPLPAAASEPAFCEETWTRDIYPDGFTGKNICRLARLQSWSFRRVENRNA